ncbi:MAG: hypothetical protein BGO45_07775 [Microbacterium sp. 71-36]|nr:MAG: hypothetical protein ABS60_12230 [Microbacterium sp. SCN 71-17]OJV74177.1 MAG: hypothetical protein BGO45_07775 [Microbacterium sp. 71-36]
MSDRFLAAVPRSGVPHGGAPGATVARAVVPRSGAFHGAADAALPHPPLRADFSGARHGRRSPQVQQEDTE